MGPAFIYAVLCWLLAAWCRQWSWPCGNTAAILFRSTFCLLYNIIAFTLYNYRNAFLFLGHWIDKHCCNRSSYRRSVLVCMHARSQVRLRPHPRISPSAIGATPPRRYPASIWDLHGFYFLKTLVNPWLLNESCVYLGEGSIWAYYIALNLTFNHKKSSHMVLF